MIVELRQALIVADAWGRRKPEEEERHDVWGLGAREREEKKGKRMGGLGPQKKVG